MPKSLAEVAPGAQAQAAKPFMGHGVCSFPNCNANNDGGPCTFYSGTADRCLNCDHPYSYHA